MPSSSAREIPTPEAMPKRSVGTRPAGSAGRRVVGVGVLPEPDDEHDDVRTTAATTATTRRQARPRRRDKVPSGGGTIAGEPPAGAGGGQGPTTPRAGGRSRGR